MQQFKSMWYGYLGQIIIAKYRLELKNEQERSLRFAPYRAGPKARKFQEAEIQETMDLKVVDPVKTEWVDQIVFAPKKDGSVTFCVNYRNLSAVSVRDSYPIPQMNECCGSFVDGLIFYKLDSNRSSLQIDIEDSDRDETAFPLHHELYRFSRMLFGLGIVPWTFHRTMDVTLSPVKWQLSLLYLHDIKTFSRTVGEHIEHLRPVLPLPHRAIVTMNLKKASSSRWRSTT